MGVGLILWILLIVGVVWFVKYLADQKAKGDGESKGPMEILKERYARGELSEQEFEERKRVLEES